VASVISFLMIIRPVNSTDLAAITRLNGHLGYPAAEAKIAARLNPLLLSPDHGIFLAEEQPAGEVMGWVHVYCYRVLESDARAEIGGLVCDPQYRRRGVGTALMQKAEDWARDQKLPIVSLRSNITRTEAHLFYQSLGYSLTKTQHTLRKTL